MSHFYILILPFLVLLNFSVFANGLSYDEDLGDDDGIQIAVPQVSSITLISYVFSDITSNTNYINDNNEELRVLSDDARDYLAGGELTEGLIEAIEYLTEIAKLGDESNQNINFELIISRIAAL